MKQKFINMYMNIADIVSQQSSAKRLQVGAIVVKDDRIISIGYNGMPSGWDNECEIVDRAGALITKPEVLHAESNAIAKLAKSSESGLGAALFITHSPCMECAKLIYQSGIKEIYYREEYRSNTGIEFLRKSGIKITKLD